MKFVVVVAVFNKVLFIFRFKRAKVKFVAGLESRIAFDIHICPFYCQLFCCIKGDIGTIIFISGLNRRYAVNIFMFKVSVIRRFRQGAFNINIFCFCCKILFGRKCTA